MYKILIMSSTIIAKENMNLSNDFTTPPNNVTIRKDLSTPKKKKQKEPLHEKCSICLDTISKNTNKSTTACKHTFCLTCLHEHLKTNNTCPNCRRNILDKMPPKPVHKIKRKEAIDIVTAEVNNWDFPSLIEALEAFKSHGRYRLITEFESMGLNIINELMSLQNNDDGFIYDDDSETEIEDNNVETEEEEEEDDEESVIIPVRISIDRRGNVTNSRVIHDSDDEEILELDQEEAVFEG